MQTLAPRSSDRNRSEVGDDARITDANASVHTPVMLREVMEHLALRANDSAVDCTFGGGGYTRAMLAAVAPHGRVLALDRDPDAIDRGMRMSWTAQERERLTFVRANFDDLPSVMATNGFLPPRGVVADLGLSSLQLGASNRGFSFHGGALDMRFDPTSDSETAADLLTNASEDALARMIHSYGEEPAARRIAAAIVAERVVQPIRTAEHLAALIERTVHRHGRIHPATRTFQALRIAVNDELGALERGVRAMIDGVAVGGRVVIVNFHSLEDRIVKRAFRSAAAASRGRVQTKKPVTPSRDEQSQNPRSRSAKLRMFERTC